jgi:hypothetical protein
MNEDEDEVECEIEFPYDAAEIERGLALYCDPERVYELRALGVPKCGVVSGYYNTAGREAFVEDCAGLSGDAGGVYLTINPVNPVLLARSVNRAQDFGKHTTTDGEIVARRWLPLDFDPVRPAGISSTDEEHAAALECAQRTREYLLTLGFPAGAMVLVDSGNGAHLLCRIELANDDASRDLVKSCIDAVAARFTDSVVKVDQTTFNAARIWKVPGTMARKGDHTDERPHRLARLIDVPEEIVTVPNGTLRNLAALVPPRPEPVARSAWDGRTTQFDLDAWLVEHELDVEPPKPWNGGRLWALSTCPWNPQHTNKSAFIVQHPNGAISARCHHDSCQGNGWSDLRAKFEPGYREVQSWRVPPQVAGAPPAIARQFQQAARARSARKSS